MRKYRNVKKTCSFLRTKGKGIKKPVYIPKEKIDEEDEINTRSSQKDKSSSFYKNKYKKRNKQKDLERLNTLLWNIEMKRLEGLVMIPIESIISVGGDILL